jgi:hypothetical protein
MRKNLSAFVLDHESLQTHFRPHRYFVRIAEHAQRRAHGAWGDKPRVKARRLKDTALAFIFLNELKKTWDGGMFGLRQMVKW